MKNYDFIIAGGGCAGLSLAYYLSQSKFAGASVLIIDREEKAKNDRTWCFWTEEPTAYDRIVARKWAFLSFADFKGILRNYLKQKHYQLIKSVDFYRFTKEAIQQRTQFQWLRGNIAETGEDDESPYVEVEGKRYRAKWIFDSRYDWQNWQKNAGHHHFLLQHFMGWIVETELPVFDADSLTLMDFRVEQQQETRFIYVLPFSKTQALVEFTVFSAQLEPKVVYEQALKDYFEKEGIRHYQILETEYGVIPMTNMPLKKATGEHIIQIGTAGGAVKPTTGYAFLNIQRQTQAIVRQLEKGEKPCVSTSRKLRFKFYDQLLLNMLQNEGESVQQVFSALFRRNKISHILNFLDEQTNIWQELRILARLPWLPFLRALVREYF